MPDQKILDLNESIRNIQMPPRIARLPISPKGYPVPWFVNWQDGVPDFRVIGPGKTVAAVKLNLCWICGGTLGQFKVFVIGPMCSINRVSAEPPSHLDCAEYAARACPFLTKPNMRRNEKNMPPERKDPPGMMIRRNPGVTALWISKHFTLMRVDHGTLFNIGEPERVEWFAEGRTATRAEVDESIRTGLPALEEAAASDGPEGIAALREFTQRAQKWLP